MPPLVQPPYFKSYYGSQICQIWRVLRQNCSDDSTEVTEGVTSNFRYQIHLTLIVNIVNLNYVIEIKELYTTKQEEGKQVNYDQSLLDDRQWI